MIYVTADLHGNREGFLNLIEKTGLNNADTMYVLGDVIDRGSDSMGLLLDMACRSNVIPFLATMIISAAPYFRSSLTPSPATALRITWTAQPKSCLAGGWRTAATKVSRSF